MYSTHPGRSSHPEKILRLPEVKRLTGISRSLIYLKISKGKFPSQITLGERSVGWLESEINDWINSRIKESRREGTHHV